MHVQNQKYSQNEQNDESKYALNYNSVHVKMIIERFSCARILHVVWLLQIKNERVRRHSTAGRAAYGL